MVGWGGGGKKFKIKFHSVQFEFGLQLSLAMTILFKTIFIYNYNISNAELSAIIILNHRLLGPPSFSGPIYHVFISLKMLQDVVKDCPSFSFSLSCQESSDNYCLHNKRNNKNKLARYWKKGKLGCGSK